MVYISRFLNLRNQPGWVLESHGVNRSVCTVTLFLEESCIWARKSLAIEQEPLHFGCNLAWHPSSEVYWHTSPHLRLSRTLHLWPGLESTLAFRTSLHGNCGHLQCELELILKLLGGTLSQNVPWPKTLSRWHTALGSTTCSAESWAVEYWFCPGSLTAVIWVVLSVT